jgi:ketosteroid isomerase-like protein
MTLVCAGMRTFNAVLCAVTLISIAACERRPGDLRAADVDALRSTDAGLTEAVKNKDLERIVAFYAHDASILPVAQPMITGGQAIREEWEHLLSIPGFQSTTTTTVVEVSRAGDLGYTQGTYSTTFGLIDGTTGTEHGKWISIWKKQTDGAWKVAVEIYNTDAPPPPHAHP